jgi:hypothetical protein
VHCHLQEKQQVKRWIDLARRRHSASRPP